MKSKTNNPKLQYPEHFEFYYSIMDIIQKARKTKVEG
jgi:hypothetical protein